MTASVSLAGRRPARATPRTDAAVPERVRQRNSGCWTVPQNAAGESLASDSHRWILDPLAADQRGGNVRVVMAFWLALLAGGCRSYPDFVYYPNVDDNGQWDPTDPIGQTQQDCIDSLNSRRSSIRRQGGYQDFMILLGSGVSAAGGVTAAALSQQDSASATPTTVSASIAAAGAVIAVASKLGADPSKDTVVHSHKRKHYDAGLTVYRQFTGTSPMPTDVRRYIIARFQACASPDPADDPPQPPAGTMPAPM